MLIDELLCCPSCRSSLRRRIDCLACSQCRRDYPILEDDIIDFMPGCAEEIVCWDEEAEIDEIRAAVSVPKQEASDIFVKLPPVLPTCEFDGKICVDLGCGYGRTLIYSNLKGRPQVSIGADISVVMLKKARKYCAQHGVKPVLVRADISSLPIRSAIVDLIYSAGVLIHLPKQKVEAVVREMDRTLKVGGSAVLENSFLGWLNLDGVQTRIITGLFSKWLRPAWVRTYTHQEVHRLFVSRADFSFVDIQADGYRVLPKRFLNYSFPQVIKGPVNSLNQNLSSKCSFKNLFVSGWTVRVQK